MVQKWLVILGVLVLAAPVGAAETAVPSTQKEKVSYAVGVEIGRSFKRQGTEVEAGLLVKGIMDALGSEERLLMSEDDLRRHMSFYHKEVRRKQADIIGRKQTEAKEQQGQALKTAQENKKAGEAFLAANKTKEGVVVLPSGLQYKVLKAAEGKTPADTDRVECHYRGTLIDGTEFDSSYSRGQPATFGVKGVIAGWREALKLMSAGSKWQLFVPSNLAYGERGTPGKIGPNATLIFEVELIAIK